MTVTYEIPKAPAHGDVLLYTFRIESSGELVTKRGVYCEEALIVKQIVGFNNDPNKWLFTGNTVEFHRCIMWFVLEK